MTRRLRIGATDGYTMAAVMLVMLATSILATATFAAVGADLPFARAAQDRKQAYAAAEAGVEYYLYQLTRDNDYWKTCDTAPGPAGQPNPVNQVGPEEGRRWRAVAGAPDSKFSIELLAANGAPLCATATPEMTLINMETGTFRIRSTGMSRDVKRSVVTTLRRDSFLDYLYFTDYEAIDPLAFDDSDDQEDAADCVKYRPERDATIIDGDPWCRDNMNITFPDWDAIRGPLHTNDSLLTCGTPEFGRPGKNDRIGIVHETPNGKGWVSSCSGQPKFEGVVRNPAGTLNVPSSNSRLKSAALTGYVFSGKTDITFNSPTTMDVRTRDPANVNNEIFYDNMLLPSNGVIYVEKVGACVPDPPRQQDYDDGNGCAILTVRGQYPKSMTLGSRDDILIDGNLTRTGDQVLGLIAQRFVRVKHDVVGDCGSNIGSPTNITIQAAILALNDSFVLDNWRCGGVLGNLTVDGAIAQRFRGAVGQFNSSTNVKIHGYSKDYKYDDRLRYRSPPYFLDPISAAWRVVRNNEQVPAAD